MTDGGMALYTGTCGGALTQVACDDDASANGLMPKFTATKFLGRPVRLFIYVFFLTTMLIMEHLDYVSVNPRRLQQMITHVLQ